MQKIFARILAQEIFLKNPPVLVDVGASGSIHARFKPLAKASVCVAFDADDREMHQVVAKDSKDFKKLYVVNSVLSEKDNSEIPFFLTKYPYCSSTLKPDSESLRDWDRAEIFEIEKLSSIKATTLRKVFGELNLSKVDWFKTDSQGTDLRLFKSLGEDLIKKVLVAEFEPGSWRFILHGKIQFLDFRHQDERLSQNKT
jgi:FkbM family methyltransferase